MEPFVSLASFQNLWWNYFLFSPVKKALPPVVVLGVGKQQARQPFKTSSGLAVPAGNDVLSRNSSSAIVISCVSYSRAIFIVITHWGEQRQDGFHLKRGMWDCARPWEASRGTREVGRTEFYEILTRATGNPSLTQASGNPELRTWFLHNLLILRLITAQHGWSCESGFFYAKSWLFSLSCFLLRVSCCWVNCRWRH